MVMHLPTLITSGNTEDAFAIGSTDGKLTVAKSGEVDYTITPLFTLSIEVSDGELTATADITINVTPEDDTTLGMSKKSNPLLSKSSDRSDSDQHQQF